MADNLQHEDFGEKIGGAKKDLWKDRGLYVDDLGSMNEREAEKFVKKDNVWKKPDYQAMLDDGVPLGVVYFIKKARDSLGASPQYRYSDTTPERRRARQEEYIETVRQLQAVIEDVRTLDDAMQAYDRFLVQNGYVEQVQGWGSGIHYRATKKGQDNPVITNKLAQTLYIRSASYFEQNFTQKAQKEQFGVSKDQKVPKGYAIHFNDGKNTYSQNDDWKSGTYYVTKGYTILQTNFESREAALKWVQDFVRQRNKGGKIRFTPPQLADVKRTGPDYRSSQEITGQHYLNTFGFRGGEFGNWMSQNDRQASLNMGFEALKDLAAALQISDQDIAFGGTLAIAFGARGSGNAVAHYEPLRKVINLTKMHGAGSLAHEWWHGFDDYLGAKMGAKGMLSEQPRLYPLFQKLIDTMKYKPETPEQAAKRTEAQNSRTKKNAESWLDSAVLGSLKRHGDESTLEQYAALKDAFLSGEVGSVDKISALKKSVSGHVLPKSERDRLGIFERMLHGMQEQETPRIGRTETDYYRNSVRMGNEYEKDGGYWDSNEEMTARAFACYVKDKLSYASDYLAGHAECAVSFATDKSGETEVLKAYPQGEERRAINAVFDEIVADLKLQHILTHAEKTLPLTVQETPLAENEQISIFTMGSVGHQKEEIMKGGEVKMSDYFSALIQNRSEFEKGNPAGIWLDLPATKEQLYEALDNLNIDNPKDLRLHGHFVTDSKKVDIPLNLLEEPDFNTLNFLAARLENLDESALEKLNAVCQSKSCPDNLRRFLDYPDNEGCFGFISGVFSQDDLREYYQDEFGMEIPEDIIREGYFTRQGYLYLTDRKWMPKYEIQDIPPEYQIMGFPESERAVLDTNTEEKKSEKRTDIYKVIDDYVPSIGTALERINNNNLKEKDALILTNLLLELKIQILQVPDHENIRELRESLTAVDMVNEGIDSKKVEQIEAGYGILQRWHLLEHIPIPEKSDFVPREDGRTYIPEVTSMKHEEYLQYVQNLKDIGAKFDSEKKQWYVEQDWKPQDKNEKFKVIYYENNEKKICLSGTKEAALKAVRELRKDAKDNERCYIHQFKPDSGVYAQEGIYLINSGKDITPVKIKIPPMSKENFDKARLYLKNNGAKFKVDPNRKSGYWYIERNIKKNISQIKDYLETLRTEKSLMGSLHEKRELAEAMKNDPDSTQRQPVAEHIM